MKDDLFKVKKLDEDEIIVEEEKEHKNPIVIFFLKYGNIIYLGLMFLAVSTFLIGLGLTISNLDSSTVPGEVGTGVLMSLNGNSSVMTNGVPISDSYALKMFNQKSAASNLNKGVVLTVSIVDFANGTITYYSDKSALIRYNDNTYLRVMAVDGNYGVDNNGNINANATTKEVTCNKETKANMDIFYFSDGSAEVQIDGLIMFIRNSEDIYIDDGLFKKMLTSGISVAEGVLIYNNVKINYLSDGAVIVNKDGVNYIFRNDDYEVNNNGDMVFTQNNAGLLLKTVTLNDNTIIEFYDDGSALVTKGIYVISVRKSGNIVYNQNGIIEIAEQSRADLVSTKKASENVYVNIYDDGSAVVISGDNKTYVEDCALIRYNEDGSIKSMDNTSNVIETRILPDNTKLTHFANGKTLVETDNGSYIVNTSDLKYDANGNINDSNDLLNGKSINISNDTGTKISYKVVIEETNDYTKYNRNRLTAFYVKYIIGTNGSVFGPNRLSSNVWEKGTNLEGGLTINKDTYILYEGELEPSESIDVDLALWIDYDITNEYQDTSFIGTVKLYIESVIE